MYFFLWYKNTNMLALGLSNIPQFLVLIVEWSDARKNGRNTAAVVSYKYCCDESIAGPYTILVQQQ